MHLHGELEAPQLGVVGGDEVEGVRGDGGVQPVVGVEEHERLHDAHQHLHGPAQAQVAVLRRGGAGNALIMCRSKSINESVNTKRKHK